MLIDFTVENYRSIRDAKKLSMVASSAAELPQNVIDMPDLDLRVLGSAAIYGANASGKSNLLRAMFALGSLVRPPLNQGPQWNTELTAFLLDSKKASAQTKFRVRFLVDRILYDYSLSATQGFIDNESLVAYPSGRPQEWFRRDHDQFHFSKENYLKGQKQKLKELATHELTFLAVANAFGHPQLSIPGRWLASNLVSRLSNGFIPEMRLYNDGEFFSWASMFLRRADFGIQSIEFRPEAQPPLTIIHGNGGKSFPFNLTQESTGTVQFLFTLSPLYDVLQHGQLLIVDEFRWFHSELAHEIVRLFHDPQKNPHGAQLIFATHDTSLLHNQLMRRDQIWFTEKDRAGATDLYSLQDFKGVKEDTDFGKGYLRGRYGAIPFLGEIETAATKNRQEKLPSAEPVAGPESAGTVAP